MPDYMFGSGFSNEKLTIGYSSGRMYILKSGDTRIVKCFLVKALFQPTPFQVHIFFHSLISVEACIAKKLGFFARSFPT